MDREKIHSMFISIEHKIIGITSQHWVIRGVQGFAPKQDKAPWWLELEKEPALSVVKEFRTSLKQSQKAIKQSLKILDKIEREIKS